MCGELSLQSATLMTQTLNIASDINRASHRANTGPPSPSTGSHAQWLSTVPPPASLFPDTVLGGPPTPWTKAGSVGTLLTLRQISGAPAQGCLIESLNNLTSHSLSSRKPLLKNGEHRKGSGSSQRLLEQRIQAAGKETAN